VLTKLELDGVSIDATREQNLALPDPDDEPFLGVALAGRVAYLVTGNLAHYPAERRKGCVVVSPAEFMKAWRKANEEAG